MASIRSDDDFFDKVFEPLRLKVQKAFNLPNLSQKKFTSFIYKSGGKFSLPKKWRQKIDF